MWRELLGDNGDRGCLTAVRMIVGGMEEWEAEMRAAVRARSALKFGEDGACREAFGATEGAEEINHGGTQGSFGSVLEDGDAWGARVLEGRR